MIPRLKLIAVLLFALIMTGAVQGQTPVVNFLQPAAVAPGATTEVTCVGEKLSEPTVLWTSFAAKVVPVPDKCDRSKAVFRITVPAGTAQGVGAVRLATKTGLSALRFVLIDDLANVAAMETNGTMASAQLLKLPIAVEGACRTEGYSYFKFEAGKGQRINIDVVARRLGSSLDPLVRVLDSAGRELAYLDDSPSSDGDCQLVFTPPARGTYLVELRDSVYGGGAAFRYRMRVGRFPLIPWRFQEAAGNSSTAARSIVLAEPNDSPDKALKVTLPTVITGKFEKPKDQDWIEFSAAKGDRVVSSAWSRGLGSACDVELALFSADGKKIATSPAGERDPIVFTNIFSAAGIYRLRVEELNGVGGPGFGYRVEIAPQTPGFTLSADLDQHSVIGGSNVVIKVACPRRDFNGPIRLAVVGLPVGFEVESGIIEEKKLEGELTLKIPDGAKAGELLNFQIVGRATVGNAEIEVQASTMTALRRLFPELAYPPAALDGWIALGVRAANSTIDAPAPARKKKK